MAVPTSASSYWIPADLPDNDSDRLQALTHMGLLQPDTIRSLTWQAVQSLTYDPLTKVPGARLFEARIGHLLQASDNRFAVLMVNCHRFRIINEVYGRSVGDGVLRTVARRLQRLKQPSMLVARLHNDRFGILLSKAHQHLADEVIEQIIQTLDRPMRYKGHHYRLGFSLGITWRQQGQQSNASQLMRNAERTLRSADKRTQNAYVSVFEQAAVTLPSESSSDDKFIAALHTQTLPVSIQPTVNMRTGQVYHYHACASWQDNGETIPATALHNTAERLGMMPQLTEYVLTQAITQFASANQQNASLCVKLSRLDLANTRLARVASEQMKLHGLDEYRLQLELSADNDTCDWHGTVSDLFELSQAELVRHPQRQPVSPPSAGNEKLQVTKTYRLKRPVLVRALNCLSDMQMLTASIDMARSMGMNVVADGIDSAQLRDCALELGVLYGSGPLFGDHVPLSYLR